MDQAERDAKVTAAFEAYGVGRTTEDEQGRTVQKPFPEQRARWEAMWEAADFSWEALADAGWERGKSANQAQELKRWRAPVDFPLDVPVTSEGEKAFKPATLQDYWRWVPNQGWSENQGWAGGRLANDDELKALGLLVEVEGRLWHALHRAELRASVTLDSPDPAADLRNEAANSTPQMGPEPQATALAAAMLQRLTLAKPGFNTNLTGARAQGLDAVWRAFAGFAEAKRPLALTATLATFDSCDTRGLSFAEADFWGASFAAVADFREASFAAKAHFSKASFAAVADFQQARFAAAARFWQASFAAEADFSEASFAAEAEFDRVSFAAQANFREASFAAEADFRWASFAAEAHFSEASFAAEANFREASFAAEADFEQARFAAEAHFSEASFAAEANFSEASFAAAANFERARFAAAARFWQASFAAEADFFKTSFAAAANFEWARFAAAAHFLEASFAALASFWQASFAAAAKFDRVSFAAEAHFDRASFAAEADFEQAHFDRARFRQASFAAKANFERASFAAKANFERARFAAEASFGRTEFKGWAGFGSTTFGGTLSAPGLTCTGRFEMRAAEVKGYADFSGATWPTKLENQHAAFEGCRFRDVANFKTEGFSAFALFDGAEFKGRVLLSDPGEAGENALFATARKAAQAAVAADKQAKQDFAKAQRAHQQALAAWERNEASKPEKERAKKPEAPQALAFADERGPDKRFAALAGGLRTLKLAMAAQSDINREQRFYRYEIQARARMPAEPWPAKLAAAIYGAASDYGASVGRPFVALAVVLAVFSAGYCGASLGLERFSPEAALSVAGRAGPALLTAATATQPLTEAGETTPPPLPLLERYWHALSFSVTNTFRPLSALSAEGLEGNPVAAQLLDRFGPGWGVTVRLLAVLQSLIAIVMAFLVGLAVRRRFQIA